MLEAQHKLNEAGDTGSDIEMPDAGLHRPHCTESVSPGAAAECFREPCYFDRITKLRTGSMSLDIAHITRGDSGKCMRFGDSLRLCIHTRSRIPRLPGSIIVYAGSSNNRSNIVAVGDRIFEPLEHYDSRTRPQHHSAGIGIKRPAMTIGRSRPTLLVKIAGYLRHTDRNPSGKRHIRLAAEQALARHMHRDERGRTRRLHHHARP